MAANGTPYLTAQAILEAPDLRREEVLVPEWGGKVIISEMDSKARDNYEAIITVRNEKARSREETYENIRALLVVRCAVDEAGNRLFTDEQAEALGKKSASAVQRLFNIASRLNALSKADVDELAKNSEGTPAADSPMN